MILQIVISKRAEDYSKLYTSLENIPDAFVETNRQIKTNIENYIETLNNIQGIENEKFYSAGFSDAINLIVECLLKDTNNKKNSEF